ncbi:hypothetical protein P171DRAFT_486751 [Karstenula rhodostoma CBS 690.94]|uniref:Uncharacterized protein n=1 Tax=Karstenula rhodostoma CBS 690.94 TaxID=1392251 RepID=A0A9P4PF17_9PLEO|nr:hypothetical protein P171DRAFT_486751 [Karstenula rhodostoma CBS 690.94]
MSTEPRQVLQERLAAIFAEAKEQGLDQHDLLPLEVQDNFQNMLQTANSRISSLEDEAEEMKKKNLGLETQLKRAQQTLETRDIPEDANHLQVELDLTKISVDFYRRLMNEAENRATNYQEKWQEALRKQTAAEAVDKKIDYLKAENRDLQQSKTMIAEELRKMKDLYDKLRDKDLATIVDKEEKLMASEKQLGELKTTIEELENENNAVEEQYHEVMSSLDAVVTETTDGLNAARAHARAVQQQKSATFSEIQPLRKFFGHTNDVLNIYQGIFKKLLNPTEPNVTIPCDFNEMVTARLHAASGEYEAFLTVRALLMAEGLSDTEHSEQLDDLATSAQYMHKSLDLIREDLAQFLWALQRRPDLPRLIRMKFSVLI